MKVFISADIEGAAFTVTRESCRPEGCDYERCRQEMTAEVLAACEGARAAGADEVVVKDAHGPGTNLCPEQMPEYVRLIRGWSMEPNMMIEGLDGSFDAAFYVGYHSAAGQEGNALSHTIHGGVVQKITVNGQPASEFQIYSWLAAYYGVPSVLLTGDRALCEAGRALHPGLVTAAVKDDVGGRSEGLSPAKAQALIRQGAEQALRQDLAAAKIALPPHFRVELTYKDHKVAYAKGFYPGAEQVDPCTIAFESDDWYEVNRFLVFVIM